MRKPYDQTAFVPIGGRMDRRITLFSPTETSDGAGGFNTTWTNAGSVWASYMPRDGREEQDAAQYVGLTFGEFRIRYNANVTSKWRLSFRSTVYQVDQPPMEAGRGMFTDIIARALSPLAAAVSPSGNTLVDGSGNILVDGSANQLTS